MSKLSPVLFLIMFSIVDVMSTNIVMAFSSSVIHSASVLSVSNREYFSPHSRSRNTMHMGTSVDVPFCAEAFASEISYVDDGIANEKRAWDVHINQLEHGKKMSGYDVSSARGWMEYIEQRDGSLYGVGAYSVVRCDAVYSKHQCHWKIWGLDFHTSRLCSSYTVLLESLGSDYDGDLNNFHSNFEESKLQTDELITVLLEEAKKSLQLKEEPTTKNHTNDIEGEDAVRTLMVTIFWTPPKIKMDGNPKEHKRSTKPIIRGHAVFAGAAHAQNNDDVSLPSPISACLAIPSDPTPEALALLPRRHSDHGSGQAHSVGASAKVSSWCRIRRPLEEPTRYKVPGSGVGEVLLVRQDKSRLNDDQQHFINSLEILEGLTSNLFVIYKDGTVRTAPVGKVLSGYARHLIVEELNGIQLTTSSPPGLQPLRELTLDTSNAPTIQDAKDGLWSEAFVASAIRLIVPVNRVLIPPTGDMESIILWQSDSHPLTRSIWSAIHKRGYKSATFR